MEPVIEFTAEGFEPLYVCGGCKMVAVSYLINEGVDARDLAVLCCWCTRCFAAPRKEHRTVCEPCEKIQRAEQEAARLAKMLAVPVVNPAGFEMFFDDRTGRFDEDLDTLADYHLFSVEDDGLTYDDIDWSQALVQPCSKRQVGTPDLLEDLDEAWGSDFTDDSGPYLPSEAAQVKAKELQALLEKEAPVIYEPILTQRIDMAASQANRPKAPSRA